MPASGTKLAHLDVVERTALFRRRARLACSPRRTGNSGMLHARRLRLQVRLAPQLPGLVADRTHGCWFWLRRTNCLWPTTRALRGGRSEFFASFARSRPTRLASGRRRSDARQCLGSGRGRGIDRCLLLVCVWHRTFGLGRGPQHNGPVDQIDLEPVATVQAKLLAQDGGQRNPPLIVEFKRRHERGFPRLYADAHDSAADVKQLAWLRYCIMLLAWQLAKGRKSAAPMTSIIGLNRSAVGSPTCTIYEQELEIN